MRYAAIAQPVERILGKDEVASSNLASSSTLQIENAAIAQPVERILGKDEVASSNLASSSKTPDSTWNREFFFCLLVQSMLELPFLNSGILQKD